MKATKHFSPRGILSAVALATFGLVATVASAATVNAIYNSATDVPVTASGYTATGNTVNFTLNFAPATGTDLMVVSNTALPFIDGTFDNLAQGQPVALSYGGVTYRFVANYYGGSGNDLVLVWASNRAFAWGWNGYGQLGDNTTTNRSVPVPITSTGVLAGKTIVSLAAGGHFSLALCSDGTLAAWGWGRDGELGEGTNAPALPWVEGLPVAVDRGADSALYEKTVVAIAAGWSHSMALCSDGTVAAWGVNASGQIGDNTTTNRHVPVAVNTDSGVSALSGKTVVAIAAGESHSLALCSDGTMAAWGYNYYGQLGNYTTTEHHAPVAVNTTIGVSALYGKTVTAIAAGGHSSAALCLDGTMTMWGYNVQGNVGDGTTTTDYPFGKVVPVAVNRDIGLSALSNKTAVAIEISLALCSDGRVATWGYNADGELGDGTMTERHVPVLVSANLGSELYGRTATAIAAGSTHDLALCSDGTLAAWGFNGYGQLGDSTTTTRLVPVAVNTSPLAASQRFTRIVSGASAEHTLALVAAPSASDFTPIGTQTLTGGSFQLTFTNNPGAFFGVLAVANPTLPLSNWTALGDVTEVSPGQFQFTDPQATTNRQRFYRVRSP